MFKRKKKNHFMGSIGVGSLAEVGRRLKYLERALMKHGMAVAADSLNVEPTRNKYVDVFLHVVLFENAIKDSIPEEPVPLYMYYQDPKDIAKTDRVVSCICDILEKQKIPYRRNKVLRPLHQLTIPEQLTTKALVAVFNEQDRIIDEFRTELYKLRGMTKNEQTKEFAKAFQVPKDMLLPTKVLALTDKNKLAGSIEVIKCSGTKEKNRMM